MSYVVKLMRVAELESYRKFNAAQKFHAERMAARKAVNGQPNGYQPISEAELKEDAMAAQWVA